MAGFCRVWMNPHLWTSNGDLLAEEGYQLYTIVASIRLWFANVLQVAEQLYFDNLILYSTINYYTTCQLFWPIWLFVRKETQNLKLKSAARQCPNSLESWTVRQFRHVWNSMFGDLWNLYASQVWCEQKLDMMAWIERPSLKLWDQKWIHAFTTGLVIGLSMCLNCFLFAGYWHIQLLWDTWMQSTSQLTKENTWGCLWGGTWIFHCNGVFFCSGFKLAHDLLLASKVWFGWGQCCNLQWVFFASARNA